MKSLILAFVFSASLLLPLKAQSVQVVVIQVEGKTYEIVSLERKVKLPKKHFWSRQKYDYLYMLADHSGNLRINQALYNRYKNMLLMLPDNSKTEDH